MDAATQSSPSDTQFLDLLLDQKFADRQADLTPEVRDELKRDLITQMDNFIIARVLEAFSDEQVEEFEKLIKEGKSREQLQQYAKENTPDFTNFVANALIEFQTVYLGG